MSDVVAIVPIRDFTGLTRLEPVLSPIDRERLARLLADRVADATTSAGLTTMVVTSAPEVWSWAITRSLAVVDDPGTGLSGAAASGVAAAEGHPWLVVHADLPLVTSGAISAAASVAEQSVLLVPSHDGGTTVVGGFGRFPFAYGPGSFHRHLRSRPDAVVAPSAELSVDLDTPVHLAALPNVVSALRARPAR